MEEGTDINYLLHDTFCLEADALLCHIHVMSVVKEEVKKWLISKGIV
jgi:hypothetical protein